MRYILMFLGLSAATVFLPGCGTPSATPQADPTPTPNDPTVTASVAPELQPQAALDAAAPSPDAAAVQPTVGGTTLNCENLDGERRTECELIAASAAQAPTVADANVPATATNETPPATAADAPSSPGIADATPKAN